MTATNSPWTDDEIDTIINLWPSMSAQQIAKRVQRTRNAVMGKLSRLGVLGDRTIQRPQVRPRKIERRAVLRLKRPVPAPKPPKPEPPTAPVSLCLSLEQLTDRTCKYMAGDPLDGGTFCGHRTEHGSYCPYHTSRVWVPR